MINARRFKRWRSRAGLLFLCAAVGLVGCELLDPSPPTLPDVAASSLERDATPDVDPEDLDALVRGNAAFAFDLLHVLSEPAGNLFYSPYSVSAALAMVYAGARGETARQMGQALRFDLDQDTLHPAFNRLDLELARRGEVDPPYEGEGFELRIVNAAWGQRGYTFLARYLDVLAVSYGAGVRLLDFVEDPEGSRIKINDWVSERTNERIVDLLPSGSIDTLVRLVLTNAIYFNAPWLTPFDPEETAPGTFAPLGADAVSVSMMRAVEARRYANWTGGQAVELPYNGETLSMILFVPDRGTYEAFEAGFDLARYDEIVSSLASRQVDLRLPKFEVSYEVSLVDGMAVLGMTDAFTDTADFSGIDGTRDLSISDILHKTWVSVDEAGTEAAAATAVVFRLVSFPGPPVVVTVDRPFLFVIRDIPTGAILFVGRVVNPTTE